MEYHFIRVPLVGGNVAIVALRNIVALERLPNGGTAIHTLAGVFNSHRPLDKFLNTIKYINRQQTDECLR